jgi:hypothetical protein
MATSTSSRHLLQTPPDLPDESQCHSTSHCPPVSSSDFRPQIHLHLHATTTCLDPKLHPQHPPDLADALYALHSALTALCRYFQLCRFWVGQNRMITATTWWSVGTPHTPARLHWTSWTAYNVIWSHIVDMPHRQIFGRRSTNVKMQRRRIWTLNCFDNTRQALSNLPVLHTFRRERFGDIQDFQILARSESTKYDHRITRRHGRLFQHTLSGPSDNLPCYLPRYCHCPSSPDFQT